jgi:hypothetical protein
MFKIMNFIRFNAHGYNENTAPSAMYRSIRLSVILLVSRPEWGGRRPFHL